MSACLTDLINARHNIKVLRDTDELRRRTVRLAVAIWNDCGGADDFANAVDALKYFSSSCDTWESADWKNSKTLELASAFGLISCAPR